MTYLQSIAQRVLRATPGPWQSQIPAMTGEYPMGRVRPLKIQGKLYNAPMIPIGDADFIAHARTDIPELLDRLSVARQMIEMSRDDLLKHQPCKNWRDCPTCDALARTNAALAVIDRAGPEVGV